MNRIKAREILFQSLFQMEIHQHFDNEFKTKLMEAMGDCEDQTKYINQIFDNLIEHKGEIDEVLEKASNNWKLNRFPKVDLTILRLAVTEILYFDHIPHQVSINEAVNLVKKYSTEDSGKFVNGVLGRVIKNNEQQ